MKKFYNGIFNNVSNEEYHAATDYISRSAILDFDKSPYTYWANWVNPERKKKKTGALNIGSAFHLYILQPELFNAQFSVEPPKVLLKDAGREKFDSYKSEIESLKNSGKMLLSAEEFRTIKEMADKLKNNIDAMQLIEGGAIENSIFWQDDELGLLLKARPDILHHNIVADLKTSNNASPHHFQSEIVKYGYHIQFGMIQDGLKIIEERNIDHFVNIVIENKYPYNIGIYFIDQTAIDAGRAKYKEICLALKEAVGINKFTDYGVHTIGLPKWAI
jgi:hypothetical protein